MFVDTRSIREMMQTLEETYPDFLRDNQVPDSPAIKYYFYQSVLRMVEAAPVPELVTQKAMVLTLKTKLYYIKKRGNVKTRTITVP